jgi:hypothetical protein
MKIQRDRKADGGHNFHGGWGVMWSKGRRHRHVYVRLIPGVPLHLTWPRKETNAC